MNYQKERRYVFTVVFTEKDKLLNSNKDPSQEKKKRSGLCTFDEIILHIKNSIGERELHENLLYHNILTMDVGEKVFITLNVRSDLVTKHYVERTY